MGPIGNKSPLVQVMAWSRIGDRPLPEAMFNQFIDTYAALGGDELMGPKQNSRHFVDDIFNFQIHFLASKL